MRMFDKPTDWQGEHAPCPIPRLIQGPGPTQCKFSIQFQLLVQKCCPVAGAPLHVGPKSWKDVGRKKTSQDWLCGGWSTEEYGESISSPSMLGYSPFLGKDRRIPNFGSKSLAASRQTLKGKGTRAPTLPFQKQENVQEAAKIPSASPQPLLTSNGYI